MAEASLLLVDDDAPILRMLERTLTAEGYDVVAAADGGAALAAVERNVPDAIVLDVSMPGLDGLAVTRRLRAKGLRVPILLLTARDAVHERVAGLDAGADDYLVKPFDFAELAARLRALRRVHGDEESVILIGDWEFRPASRLINSPYEGCKVLTETEAQLLLLLAQHPDETFTRERILREVFPAGDSVGTVDTYVHYIRRKTERDVVTTVRGRGYRLGRL